MKKLLPALEDPLGIKACASVETNYEGRPFVYMRAINTKNGHILPIRYPIPVYDMSRIKVPEPQFTAFDFDKDILNECLKTREGHEIVNKMKNEKTLKIVNDYTQIIDQIVEEDPDKTKNGHQSKFKVFLKELLSAPLCDEEHSIENQLRSVKLKKTEIWNRFKQEGLVEKIKSLKTQKNES